MRIKFGRMWGNSLMSSHFEKKARRTTDLGEVVNHNSRLGRHVDLASSQRIQPSHFRDPQNLPTLAAKRCARLVRGPSTTQAEADLLRPLPCFRRRRAVQHVTLCLFQEIDAV